jgi:hypothetical protein
MTPRHQALAAALAVTLAATAGVALWPESDLVVPALSDRTASAPARAPWPALSPEAEAAWSAPAAPAAPARDEAPAPQRALAVASTPTPSPKVPWSWVGRLDDADGTRVLLVGPDGSRWARESEQLDPQWRLERITPERLHWRWLPADLAVQTGHGTA